MIIRHSDFTQEALDIGLWGALLELARVDSVVDTDDLEIRVDRVTAIGFPSPVPVEISEMRCRLTVDQVVEKMRMYRAASLDEDLPKVVAVFKVDWQRALEKDVGGRIPFIKLMRAFSGMSLKEAVVFCDRYLYRV
jgi:hypothetical protein